MNKKITKPNAILFVCNINSIRSPMAEAITKVWFDKKIFVDSCGIRFGKIDHFNFYNFVYFIIHHLIFYDLVKRL